MYEVLDKATIITGVVPSFVCVKTWFGLEKVTF